MPDPTKPITPESRGLMRMDRPTVPGDVVVADGLSLDRLYARLDAIARGRAPGDSSAPHRSVIARLQSNQRRAAGLGWTAFVLERAGGTGRLVLRGTPPGGSAAEIVPDAIPYDGPAPTRGSRTVSGVPHDDEGRIGTGLAKLPWRSHALARRRRALGASRLAATSAVASPERCPDMVPTLPPGTRRA